MLQLKSIRPIPPNSQFPIKTRGAFDLKSAPISNWKCLAWNQEPHHIIFRHGIALVFNASNQPELVNLGEVPCNKAPELLYWCGSLGLQRYIHTTVSFFRRTIIQLKSGIIQAISINQVIGSSACFGFLTLLLAGAGTSISCQLHVKLGMSGIYMVNYVAMWGLGLCLEPSFIIPLFFVSSQPFLSQPTLRSPHCIVTPRAIAPSAAVLPEPAMAHSVSLILFVCFIFHHLLVLFYGNSC